MSAHFKEHEYLHELLYRAHWQLAAALDNIHLVKVAACDAGKYRDARPKTKHIYEELENAVDLVSDALTKAGEARSNLIRLTGCDGCCSDRATKPKDS